MTRHLSPEEFVDALDGTASGTAAAHVQDCAACRDELAALRSTVEETRAVESFEPSPLFWDRFSARVGEATRALTPEPWWKGAWRPLVAATAAAGLLTLGFLLKPMSPLTPLVQERATSGPELTSLSDDDGSWSLMLTLASDLEWSDASQGAAPAEGTADAMIDELSAAQREELIRLLEKGIGDL